VRRGSARRQVLVDVPADEVWALVSRPELIHLWFPGMVACQVDGDQRVITLASGIPLMETIINNDPIQRRFQYRLNGGIFSEHLGTIDVHEIDPGRSLVVYSSDVSPAAMSLVLGGATQSALHELRRQLEAGEGPALDALARPVTEA
jgi:carbon monoxide dehydrogenase subunit G